MPNRAASRLVASAYDEETIKQAVSAARSELGADVSCAMLFFSEEYTEHLDDFLELVRVYGKIPTLIGCSCNGFIGTGSEIENTPGFSLLLLSLPQSKLQCREFTQDTEEITATTNKGGAEAWLVLANPLRFNTEHWLSEMNKTHPGIAILGGLAGGDAESIVLCRDGHAAAGGAVALGISGGMRVRNIVSQGCRPIGEPLMITGAKQNILFTLGMKPAYEVLSGVFNGLTKKERDRARHNLFAGLAMDEYIEDFKRGDFLIRNILGADPDAGAVAVGAIPRVGQTLQFQLRDRDSADEDLRELCAGAEEAGARPFASLLFACNGRGRGLFGAPHHDAGVVAEMFGPHPSAGFFCNGEIGPVGTRNFLHGYTASVALLCDE